MELKCSDNGVIRMSDLHNNLLALVKKSLWDYTPYGSIDRESTDEYGSDCSCGCKFYLPLKGKIGSDWGVCHNPESHRCGLLTSEHQGCYKFEAK